MDSTPETLFNLVKIYSPSGREAAAVSYLVSRMQALHFTRAFTDEAGNAVGVMGDGPRQIVLLGHIDTVPGEIPVRGISPPSSGKEPGARVLYGRGSVDAKGALGAFVDAVAGCGADTRLADRRHRSGRRGSRIRPVRGMSPRCTTRNLPSSASPAAGSGSRWATRAAPGRWLPSGVRSPIRPDRRKAPARRPSGPGRLFSAKAAAINLDREKIFDRLQLSLRGMDSGGDGFEEWASLRVGARLPLDLPPERWYEQLSGDPLLAAIPGISIQPVGFPIPA